MSSFLKKFFGKPTSDASPLYFKDGNAAFDYACRFLQSELREGNVVPALVLDAKEQLGADEQVVRMKDGTQMIAIRVCSSDGGFLALAGTLSESGPDLKPGDLVAWRAGKPIKREIPELNLDHRSNWVGVVLAKLKPEYALSRGWAIAEPFRQ